ncbi:unnamed protein product [Aspergillus oryzae RIB40]|uniref:DNA, SC003 n=1 Tax=Aspergillus oryzae (strain ATCC 42149 / RIB 40) TaxID=510516 RepID=Q2UJ35_ASPOR|nr:unnamed protein product [Aspergillus oryzae RIB40]BAE58430.1 unnamed protein product [Aspergillus oryzae RIB40]
MKGSIPEEVKKCIFAIIMTTSFGRPRTSPNLSSGGDLQTYRLTESQTQESKTPYTRQQILIMVYFKKGTTSDDTRIIVRNRVYPDRSAILKLYSFVRNWGSDKKYPTFSYSSWKRALKSQCGFSSWSHRVRCKLPLGKGTQEIVYVSCEQQFAAAIDAMSQSGADLEFEIVHKYKWFRVEKDPSLNGHRSHGASSKRGSSFYGAAEKLGDFEKCDLD